MRDQGGPVFVIGCGRSGTTLVYELLCEHPDFAWISNYSQRMPSIRAMAAIARMPAFPSRPGKKRKRSSYWRSRPVEGHRLWDWCTGPLPGGYERPLTGDDLTARAESRLSATVEGHVRWQGAQRFLNKNTRNTRRIPYLLRAFPDATFVHVVRDPRDTARSLTKVAFWPELPIWWADHRTPDDLVPDEYTALGLAAEFWTRELQCVRRDREGVPARQFVEIRYEQFVESPVDSVGDLLQHLGFDYPGALKSSVEQRVVRGRQRRGVDLTDGERLEIARRCGDLAEDHGYDLG